MKTFQWNHKGFTLAEMAVVERIKGKKDSNYV